MDSPSEKKLKQTRLPFTPVNKISGENEGKKRKISEESEESLPKVPRREALVVSVVKDDEVDEVIIEAPVVNKETPSLKDKKSKVRVEIGRLMLEMNELKDSMEEAVEKQEFLLAQERKLSLEAVTHEKEDLEKRLEVHFQDPEALQLILDETCRNKTRNKSTPRSSRRSLSQEKKSGHGKSEKTENEKKGGKEENKFDKLKRKEEDKVSRERMKEEERLEKERKKEEERLERERKKEEERIEKERKKEEERLMKERKKEEEKAERERKKEVERLERERRKEVERLDKERRKNQERLEKLRLEELERKKQERAAQSFASFFLKKDKKDVQECQSESSYFNSFRIKKNMRLAPSCRSKFHDKRREKFENCLAEAPHKTNVLYINLLKSSGYTKGFCNKTWVLSFKYEDEDEIEVLDEEDDIDEIGEIVASDDETRRTKQKVKVKLLQFHENQRPPYWGTWTKKLFGVSGRRPFGKDNNFFDYDYDSDEDWEVEEQGESLSDDEDKDKEEEEDEAQDDEDDGFFVGHGVLDKDEIFHEDDENDESNEEYNEDFEIMKQKLKAQAFEEEYKRKKPLKLKPKVFGCLWTEDSSNNEFAAEQLSKILFPLSAVSFVDGTIQTVLSTPPDSPAGTATSSTPSTNQDTDATPNRKQYYRPFPEEAMYDFIRLVHGNINSKIFLAKEFCTFWENNHLAGDKELGTPGKYGFSQRKTVDKLQEIADYKKVPELLRKAWIVKDDILARYVPSDRPLEIPNNSWTYILEQNGGSTPKSSVIKTPKVETESPVSASPTFSKSLITNFTKVLTQEEREEQMKSKKASTPTNSASLPIPAPKKRVSLITLGNSMMDQHKPSKE